MIDDAERVSSLYWTVVTHASTILDLTGPHRPHGGRLQIDDPMPRRGARRGPGAGRGAGERGEPRAGFFLPIPNANVRTTVYSGTGSTCGSTPIGRYRYVFQHSVRRRARCPLSRPETVSAIAPRGRCYRSGVPSFSPSSRPARAGIRAVEHSRSIRAA